ncbi:MAG: Holliday junction resolvase RuvX [Planctomycetota bacterium]|nr:Holliday junction resolvase RuvX [Planctomycetota bacterium]
MGRILGIDHGDRWFGLALSDVSQTIARPLERARAQELWDRLEVLVSEEDVEAVVVGLPRNMDGTEGPRARLARAFAERLASRSGLPVETWDERLTTVEAERRLRRRGTSPERRRAKVDSEAAQILLQSFLDARSRKQALEET